MPAFSILKGIPGDHDWPPVAVTTELGDIIASKGFLHELCDKGRLLIIGSTAPTFAKMNISRARCQEMNMLAIEISKGYFCIAT